MSVGSQEIFDFLLWILGMEEASCLLRHTYASGDRREDWTLKTEGHLYSCPNSNLCTFNPEEEK